MVPFLLLVALGFNGAVYLILGQVAKAAGIGGFTLALGQALGGALVLWPLTRLARLRVDRSGPSLRYFAGAALLGILLPAVATFLVILHIGAGLMSVAIALSPVFTASISHLVGYERLNRPRLLGILIACAGVMLIIGHKASLPRTSGSVVWLVAGLTVPFFLSCGNVFRSRFWPPGQRPIQAGAGISIVALPLTIPLALAADWQQVPTLPDTAWWALFGFVLVNAVNSLPYYKLQQLGGPLYLSLLSHMMAIFGIGLGMLFLGERHPPMVFLGIALVLLGVWIVNRYRSRAAQQPAPTATTRPPA